jgi:D-alanyl-D-alanine carboxypeptidase
VIDSRLAVRRRIVAVLAGVAVVALGSVVAVQAWQQQPTDAPTPPSASPTPSPPPSPSPSAPPEPEPPAFDKAALSIDDPNSIWVVVDKLRPLNPLDYVPPDLVSAAVPGSAPLRAEAARAMEAMFTAASAEAGLVLSVQNAYRSYATQVSLHNRLVGQLGRDRARAQSAVPGHSEHQTGLTADVMAASGVCSIQACFAETPEGVWLAQNAARFGYHLRYPAGKTDVTGYIFEPWHYRYIGVELAAELARSGVLTLEEFFGLPAAPDYAPGT